MARKVKKYTQRELDELAERMQETALELAQVAATAEKGGFDGLTYTDACPKVNQLARCGGAESLAAFPRHAGGARDSLR